MKVTTPVTAVASKAMVPIAAPIMALTADAYWYPLRGIRYYLTTPILWGNMVAMFLPHVLLTIVVFTLSYVFLYPPQAVLAFVFNGPIGLVTAWFAMIQQCLVITQGVSMIFLLPTPLSIIFDAVMTREGFHQFLVESKANDNDGITDHTKIMRIVKGVPLQLIFPWWGIKFCVKVTLNMIPVFGPLILVLTGASSVGERCVARYFIHKGYCEAEIENLVKRNRGQYFTFGLVAATLEALPFVGVLFVFTNTVGGALWACEIEARLKPGKYTQYKSRRGYLFS